MTTARLNYTVIAVYLQKNHCQTIVLHANVTRIHSTLMSAAFDAGHEYTSEGVSYLDPGNKGP